MNDIPRQKLREIFKRYGRTLIDDPRRVRALLLDLCGKYRTEIFVLVQAQEEAVAEDLLEVSDSIPLSMLVTQLTHRLVENRALSPDAARWSVESWAYALDMPIIFTAISSDEKERSPGTHTPVQPISSAQDKLHPPKQSVAPVASIQIAGKQVDWEVDYYWQETNGLNQSWTALGKTPGPVQIPQTGELKLCPHIGGDALYAWAEQFVTPQRVACLELDKPVSDMGLQVTRFFNRLTELTVDNGEYLSDQGFAHINLLNVLKILKLTWCTGITDKGFENLASLDKLEDVKIEWAHITDKGLRVFAGLQNLTHLGLRECKDIDGDGLDFLRHNKNILSLDLAGATKMVDTGLQQIGDIKQLTKLNLAHCSAITGAGLSHLRHLTQMSHLSLAWLPNLDDRTLAFLGAFPQLTSLSLSHTGITNSGLTRLRGLLSLAYLDLSGCENITDRGLRNIQHLPNLTHLNLSACKRLSSKGIDRLEMAGLSILR